MNSETQQVHLQNLAAAAAEGILRTIYGDDFTGCTTPLEDISSIIYETLAAQTAADRGLLDLYEKTHEAIAVLSTPPANGRNLGSAELQALLGERLDTIRTLMEKVAAVTAKAKAAQAEQPEKGSGLEF